MSIPSRVRAALSANERLAQDALLHALVLDGYQRRVAQRLVTILDRELVPALLDVLRTRALKRRGGWTTARVRDLLTATHHTLRGTMGTVRLDLHSVLARFAVSEAEWQIASLQRAAPLRIAYTLPPLPALERLSHVRPIQGATLDTWLERVSAAGRAAIARHIRVGVAAGETAEQLAKRLVGDPASARAIKSRTRAILTDAQAVARTALNGVGNGAREASLQANQAVLQGVQIVATLDHRTTEICREQDGKVYRLGEGPRPPFHFNCRTVVVPVTKSYAALFAQYGLQPSTGNPLTAMPTATRASMTGQVVGNLQYRAWLAQATDTVRQAASQRPARRSRKRTRRTAAGTTLFSRDRS